MADWPYKTSTWQALRSAKLAASPLCHACELRGRLVPATNVDHIESIESGGLPFPALDRLMSLCHACHSVKTAAVDRTGGDGVRFKGCGSDGLPVDPGHPAFGGYTPSKDGKAAPTDRPHRPVSTKFAGKWRGNR